jgi:aspartate aminotransferase-like enzyme
VLKRRLLTPGPVAVPERVLLAMAQPLIHHRAPDFIPVFQEVRENLKRVFQTEQDVLVLACTGTGGLEAAVSNLLDRGDRAVVVRGGKFGERFAEICDAYGIETVCVDVEWGRAVDPDAVRAAFDSAPDARALLVQASETSTGAYHPIEALAGIVRESEDRLLIVDARSARSLDAAPLLLRPAQGVQGPGGRPDRLERRRLAAGRSARVAADDARGRHARRIRASRDAG